MRSWTKIWRNLSCFPLQKMSLVLVCVIIGTAFAQSGTPVSLLGGISLNIFPAGSLQNVQDPSSPYAPNDFYTNIQATDIAVYALASNRIVQVFSKSDFSSPLQTFSNYSYTAGGTLDIVYLSLDLTGSTAVLSSFTSGTLKHLIYTADSTGLQQLQEICGGQSFFMSPSQVVTIGSLIFSYFRAPFGNDSISITDMGTNATQVITLPFLSCSFAASPDRQTALIWDSYTKVYVYSLNWAFSLRYIFNGSITASQYSTQTISFSSDSQLAVIETDNSNPITVLNLADCSVRNTITSSPDIRSTAFLDPLNRFILIETLAGNQIYDSTTASLQNIADSFPSEILQGDSESGLIYSIGTGTINCYGINITDSTGILSSYPQQLIAPVVPVVPANDSMPTNPAADNETVPPNEDSAFYYHLNYTNAQNETLSWISDKLIGLNSIVEKGFSIIFSSPLAAYFLSLFNYFTLSTLYVIVNIRLPWIVFYYLSLFYQACTGNIISQLNLLAPLPLMTPQLVTDSRPLYFNVSSDIVSANFTSFVVIGANVLLFEFLIFLAKNGPNCLLKVSRTLRALRREVYWGLTVSNVVPLILPWKYVFKGGAISLFSKINMAASYLGLAILFFFLFATLLRELKQRKAKKDGTKAALREWWDSYQNFVYPVFLLLHPLSFMIAIGISNAFALYNSFYVLRYKILQVLKGLYPVLFWSCFIVFIYSSDNLLLTMTTFFCLSVFLIGSIHYLLETVVVVVYFIYSFIKNHCQISNKVRDSKHDTSLGGRVVRRSKIRPVRIERGVLKVRRGMKKKGVQIKEVLDKIQESINIKPNIKVMNVQRLKEMEGDRDRNRKIRISKDRRQGSQLVMINSKANEDSIK